MAGLVAALATVGKIVGAVQNSDGNTAKAIYDTLNSKEVRLLKTNGSITKLLSKYIIEPMAIVSDSLRGEEVTEKLLEVNVDIFSAFWLQAFEILKRMYDLGDEIAIDLLSTDNGGVGRVLMAGAGRAVSSEGIDYTGILISTEDLEIRLTLSTEASDKRKPRGGKNTTFKTNGSGSNRSNSRPRTGGTPPNNPGNGNPTGGGNQSNTPNNSGKEGPGNSGFKRTDRLTGVANKDKWNISTIIQKEVEITMTMAAPAIDKHGKKMKDEKDVHHVIIPIIIKTGVILTDMDNILNMLAPNAIDKSFSSRLDDYRSGAISGWDFITAGDLIHRYKKNKLKDEDSLIAILNDRVTSAHSKLVDSKAIGFEKYYNMVFIDNDDMVRLNKHLMGPVFKEKYKERFMEESKSLMLSVVDRDYERVRILTKDIRGSSDISFKALTKRKDKDTDLKDMMTAMMSNKPPIF